MGCISIGHSNRMIAPFPEVPPAVQQALQQHYAIPIEPMHQTRHLLGLCRADQAMDMITHDADPK